MSLRPALLSVLLLTSLPGVASSASLMGDLRGSVQVHGSTYRLEMKVGERDGWLTIPGLGLIEVPIGEPQASESGILIALLGLEGEAELKLEDHADRWVGTLSFAGQEAPLLLGPAPPSSEKPATVEANPRVLVDVELPDRRTPQEAGWTVIRPGRTPLFAWERLAGGGPQLRAVSLESRLESLRVEQGQRLDEIAGRLAEIQARLSTESSNWRSESGRQAELLGRLEAVLEQLEPRLAP